MNRSQLQIVVKYSLLIGLVDKRINKCYNDYQRLNNDIATISRQSKEAIFLAKASMHK